MICMQFNCIETYTFQVLLFVIDINECEDNSHICDLNANCTNTEGSYICACHESFFGDGLTCQSEILMICYTHVASYSQRTCKYISYNNIFIIV